MFENKNIVLDTSVLIDSPQAIHNFPTNNIFITLEVLEELDKLKIKSDNVGRAARYVNRYLDDLRQKGSLLDGVTLENLQTIFVIDDSQPQLEKFIEHTNDNKIISTAFRLKEELGDIIVLSNDIAFRLKCDALSIESHAFSLESHKNSSKEKFTGIKTIEIERNLIDIFFEDGKLKLEGEDFYPNEAVILKSNKTSALTIANENKILQPLKYVSKNSSLEGLQPRSAEQNFAMEFLLDPNISLVTIDGVAGTGKTLMAIAAAMQQIHKGNYKKIIISRPAESMSKELGFLPGPQPLDAKVLTPNGWKLMGELQIGDKVIARDGTPSEVLNIFKKGIKKVYEVTTNDGRKTQCCMDHLWYTETYQNSKYLRDKVGSVKTTKEILDTLYTKEGKLNHYLPTNKAAEYSKNSLPIPPYTLGTLIGDGSLGQKITLASKDSDILERVAEEIKSFNCKLVKNAYNISYCFSHERGHAHKEVSITNITTDDKRIFKSAKLLGEELGITTRAAYDRCRRNTTINNIKFEFTGHKPKWNNPIKNALDKLGLLFTKSINKFIPKEYLFASINDRVSLLQGLLDTDGTIKQNGEISFCTTSEQLAIDIVELVRGLGGKSSIRTRNRIGKIIKINNVEITVDKLQYEFNISLPNDINPFYISRKANRRNVSSKVMQSKIESITYVEDKEVQCILIDNPEHLYITDDYIVTHNTLQEKLGPWLQPIFDNLNILYSKKGGSYIETMLQRGQIELEALSYIRGRSLPDTIFIIDEAQNISYREAKALVTRMGENSKIILTGDLEQIDSVVLNEYNSGLAAIINTFRPFKGAAHITLRKGERSPLATFASENM